MDDDCDDDVHENKLIAEKPKFERRLILKHSFLFSKKLSPSRHISSPPMQISLKQSPHKASDPSLNRFKPHSIPMHIKSQARDLIGGLESQGIIRRMKVNEQSQYCAPSGFVPKKSGKLMLVIDFTSFNTYVERQAHGFPSSD